MRTLISFLAASLVLALLWLFLRQQSAEPSLDAPPMSASEPVAAPPIESAPATRTLPTTPPVDASSHAGMRRVRVVRGDTGAAVGGATVWLLAAQPPLGASDVEPVFRAQGRETRADAEGLVALADDVQNVFARAGALTGRLTTAQLDDSRSTTPDLRLYPPHAITVRAIDPNGAPCSRIWVTALFTIARAGEDPKYGGSQVLVTEANGEAIWRDFGAAVRACASGGTFQSIQFDATVVGSVPISVVLSEVPPDGAVVEMRLPMVGRLIVQLLDPDGVPVPDTSQWKVRLRPAGAGASAGDALFGGWSAPTVEGRAVFEGVPLDQVFVVESAGVEVAGPTARQREVVAEVRLAAGAYLRGRALDADGAPLGKRMMRAILEGETEAQVVAGETAADGRFLFWAGNGKQEATGTALRCEIMVSSGDRRQLEARAGVQRLPPAVLDLGDLRFGPTEVLVSGQVLAAPHAPCTGYSLWVERRSGATWQRQVTHFTAKGADFSVFGGRSEGPLRLVIEPRANCHLTPAPVPFTPGQTDLRIQLERGCTLLLDVAFPESLKDQSTNACELRLVPTAGDALKRATPESAAGLRLAGGLRAGKSAWNGLMSGSYRLELRVAEADGALLARDVVLPDPVRDPPEVTLDLRDVLQVAGLRVSGPGGTRPQVAAVELWYREKCLPLFPAQSDETGRIALLVVPHAFDARVIARGYAPAWVRGVAGEHEVALEISSATMRVEVALPQALPPNFELRLRATALAELPADWRNLRQYTGILATLSVGREREPESIWPRAVDVVLDHEGRGQLTVQRVGTQQIALELVAHATTSTSGRAARTAAIADCTPATCDVAAGETATLRIDVPAAALAQALHALE